jgi:hypothetical protein
VPTWHRPWDRVLRQGCARRLTCTSWTRTWCVVSETQHLAAAGVCLFSYLLKTEPEGYSDGLCRTCAPYVPTHRTISHLQKECGHPFREPLQFIVITVMSVMRSPFPDTYGVFYMTVNRWCTWGPSRHRHGERHRRNALPKRLTRRRDGDDAHDADIRAYSRQGMRRYFVGSVTPST